MSFLAAEAQQVGFVHPSSAYQELNSNKWSHWLAYSELFRSRKTFLMTVVPFKMEWLAELAPVYHQEKLEMLKV